MKTVLGLDLGTNSIGWALVKEAESSSEQSSIVKLGSRIIHYGDNLVKVDKSGKISTSLKPEEDFQSGKGLSPNAGRTQQRAARRNLQRYRLRRENLIEVLKKYSIISDDFTFSEEGNATTFKTYAQRAKGVVEKIDLNDFVRVLFMINKKRGYKSSRKLNGEDEGQTIDGMAIAMLLYERDQTPGQFVFDLLKGGKKVIPDFYRSDLQAEFEGIWNFQKQFHSKTLTDENYFLVTGKSRKETADFFTKVLKVDTPELKGNFNEKKLYRYELRSKAVQLELSLSEIAEVLISVNADSSSSSGYLGGIGDRSKELIFKKMTVGQFLYSQLKVDPHTSLKNQIFYRQDYLDEFNVIWDIQAKYYSVLTLELKSEIRDIIIFYQRKLKSQKGLINFCEFETRQVEIEVDGRKSIKFRGMKVIPKSSPLFQEFKIWQILNNLEVISIKSNEKRNLNEDERLLLFKELNIRNKLLKSDVLKLLFEKPKEFELNYKEIEGNRTLATFYLAYQKIAAVEGYDDLEFDKLNADEIKENLAIIFRALNINPAVLEFNSSSPREEMEQQLFFQLWHLIYSFEGDSSRVGNQGLMETLKAKFGFSIEAAKILSSVVFQSEYGSLSAKAIRKILPHLKDGFAYGGRSAKPTEPSACEYAGYKSHSKASLTKKEKEQLKYKAKLDVLAKNSLRNPIVEKILNQTINVVNAVIDEYGKIDEIRLELARELKKSAEERKEMTEGITKTTSENEKYRKILQSEYGLKYVGKNDLVKYKLYLELKNIGFKTLYSNTYISPEDLFSKKFDIEHIIPKAKLYDDSFSNKTLELRSVNIEKADMTAMDFVRTKYGEDELANFQLRVEKIYGLMKSKEQIEAANNLNKSLDVRISKTKRDKLLITEDKIPSGFIDRELRDTQYIAKKAKELMESICPEVTTTTGSVTSRLREDWQLIDIMQEINWKKYSLLGLTEEFTNRDGNVIRKIRDWTKRNDHRHHAMDALTVAFTRRSHINYLNNMNARSDKSGVVFGIEKKEMYRDKNNRLRFLCPMPLDNFRAAAKFQLEHTLISFKASNKVTTKNRSSQKASGLIKVKIELTPRGKLHQETIYGESKKYVSTLVKIGQNFNLDFISKVAIKNERELLIKRLEEFGGDPKLAFTGKNSLTKNPIYFDKDKTRKLGEKVKIVTLESFYTVRKEISPELNVEKVIDPQIKLLLENRLVEFDGNAKLAFSNLVKNPLWLNKENGICVKRVAISGISTGIPLKDKCDHNGNLILDSSGKRIPNNFVNTGNNHHISIYSDECGILQEKAVSFFEAVQRTIQGLSAIDYKFNIEKGWKFHFTMKQNECFVFPNEIIDFKPLEIDLLNEVNYNLISPNLFRVQKISTKDYTFRHHLESKIESMESTKNILWKRGGINSIIGVVKVRINHLGRIVKVGE